MSLLKLHVSAEDAGEPIGSAERMRHSHQPLAQQGVDVYRRKTASKLLHAFGVRATEDAVVQRLQGDARTGQLSLQVFASVEAQLGVDGK